MNILDKESKKFMEELEDFRGFNQKEWDELNPNLRTLIGLRTHIVGKGQKLFKCIIGVLTDHEKRLKELEKNIIWEYREINETGGITIIEIIKTN